MRVGFGYDVHKLVEGRKLILGGVEIPFEKGLSGHSDADVLLHAIMDALLGAAALGDIGEHFPDTDHHYKGVSSLKLLSQVKDLLHAKNYALSNIDSTIVVETPKLKTYISAMRENISKTLEIALDQISVKATTSEGMGFIGRGDGVAAQAVALVK